MILKICYFRKKSTFGTLSLLFCWTYYFCHLVLLFFFLWNFWIPLLPALFLQLHSEHIHVEWSCWIQHAHNKTPFKNAHNLTLSVPLVKPPGFDLNPPFLPTIGDSDESCRLWEAHCSTWCVWNGNLIIVRYQNSSTGQWRPLLRPAVNCP